MNQAITLPKKDAQAMDQPPKLKLEGLSKAFSRDAEPVVRDLSLELAAGEIMALLGPSGCGKTTTLRMIAGFERPTAGRIELDGQDVTGLPPQDRNIGIVFQDYALIPHMTVAENITFGMRHVKKAQRPERCHHLQSLMQLESLADRYPHELSGGQQQRVALARTLAAEPRLVLLDEPFSNLDTGLRESTRNEMRDLFKRNGTSVILVTHDQAEALSFADRVGVMRRGQLCQLDSPDQVYCYPTSAFVAEFLGHTNLLAVNGLGLKAESDLGMMPLASAVQGPAMVSLRPEHLRLHADPQGEGCVYSVEFRGHDYFYQVDMAGVRYKALAPFHCRLAPGERVKLEPMEPAVVLEQ